MLAPEPFFEPRGTPFSEYHRIKALGELGYRIDLVTYPFGRDVRLQGLRIFRCPCHANDLREDATVPPAQETTNEHEHAPGADRKQRHP